MRSEWEDLEKLKDISLGGDIERTTRTNAWHETHGKSCFERPIVWKWTHENDGTIICLTRQLN